MNPEQKLQLKGCGCQEARNGGECIEEGKNCLTDNVCYLGTLDYEINHPVTRTRLKVKKKYFGLSQDSFKSRHSGHKTSFKLPKYKASTKLSTAVWKLKDSMMLEKVRFETDPFEVIRRNLKSELASHDH